MEAPTKRVGAQYVHMLASRYAPHLMHYIVWNEVASAGWMDCSPHTPNRAGPFGISTLTDSQFDFWVSKYAELVKRTAKAARRHAPHMIWTSNDRLWERPKQRDGEPLHTGVRPFLDRLWPKLGVDDFNWSLAVHPYDSGNPMDDSEFAPGHHPQAYTFATLHHVVEYQKRQAQSVGGLSESDSQAFAWLYASEQGCEHHNALPPRCPLDADRCCHQGPPPHAATTGSEAATSATRTRWPLPCRRCWV